MKVFNAFQIVCLFAGLPFIIGWLNTNPFPFSIGVFWASIIVYLIGFVAMISCVRDVMDHDKYPYMGK